MAHIQSSTAANVRRYPHCRKCGQGRHTRRTVARRTRLGQASLLRREDTPWGARAFSLADSDGFKITISSDS